MRGRWTEYTLPALRVALGLTFLVAGLTKLADNMGFLGVIENLRVVPSSLAPVVATSLPFVEIQCGLFLIGGLYTEAALGGAVALLVCFLGVTLVPLCQGREVACGCFGVWERITWFTPVRQAVMIGAALWCRSRPDVAKRFGFDAPSRQPGLPGGVH